MPLKKLMSLALFTIKFQQSFVVFMITLLAIIAFILGQFLGDSFTNSFVYNRDLIAHGEIWRLITGHLLHTNGYHLLLNVSALILLWLLHGKFYRVKSYSLLFLFCAITTSLGLYYFSPDMMQYVGLSGVLHGVFIYGAMMDMYTHDKTGYLLFIGVWLKIAHEQFYGASAEVSELIGASVAIDAHLWGAIAGLFFTLVYLMVTHVHK